MEIAPDRIRERLTALGKEAGGQTWLAKQVGMKPQGIQSILAGEVKRPRKLYEIASALKTTEAYLLRQTDDPQLPGSDSPIAAELSLLFSEVLTATPEMQKRVLSAIRRVMSQTAQRSHALSK